MQVEEMRIDLQPNERKLIREILGREPNPTELGMIDTMWSEHCSYKSSRPVLKILPKTGKQVVVGPGYDAGVVDVGDGYVVAFKLESHNHPSAIEPYNGSATGVGGIIRDILSMGCRPIALLDALRFGELENPHNRWLLQNVVNGIADYGNRIGVPTVGGEVEFDDTFTTNCLVNVACVGVGKKSDVLIPKFEHEGDLVVLIGGATGRDGIHGVTFASRTLSEESEADRPAVQVADAFTEKLVIEAELEALNTGFVHAVKDLGGGGLTCASSELAHKGGMGVSIELDDVHLREKGMTPTEILLSESQERMLMAVSPDGIKAVKRILEKYELPYSVIGKVTRTGRVQANSHQRRVVDLPTGILADAPIAPRQSIEPDYIRELRAQKIPPEYPDLSAALIKLIGTSSIASKEYVYRQYDHEVGIRTVVKPGDGDAAVLRLFESNHAIAVSADCNSNHCYVDPYCGTAGAVAQGVQNVTAVGATPLAVADGCNFGDPQKPEVFWQFTRAMEGVKHMLTNLDLPCIGGNVSFYNEDERTRRTVKPTTILVTLGLIDSLEQITTLSLKNEGEAIVAIGETRPELGGSEYSSRILGTQAGQPPEANPTRILPSLKTVQTSITEGLVTAAHDCSKGGLGVALTLMCLKGRLGAEVDLAKLPTSGVSRQDELLFSESYGRFLLTCTKSDANRILEIARRRKAAAEIIGYSVKEGVTFMNGSRTIITPSLAELESSWRESISKSMGV